MRMITVPFDLLVTAMKADASLGASATVLSQGWVAMSELRKLIANQEPEAQPLIWLAHRLHGSQAHRPFPAPPEAAYDPDLYVGPYPAWDRPAPLQVFEGAMPESNGKSNFTVILHRGDITRGITLYRSEYPGRAKYEADMMRWMIGERKERPWIRDYDTDTHSGYRDKAQPAATSPMRPINHTVLSPVGNLWVISGRRPYDDEDTTISYLADNEEQVREAFEEHLYSECADNQLKESIIRETGDSMFINFCQVLTERA